MSTFQDPPCTLKQGYMVPMKGILGSIRRRRIDGGSRLGPTFSDTVVGASGFEVLCRRYLDLGPQGFGTHTRTIQARHVASGRLR